jgi:Mycothiol maleylpyruvate isomerase N-terminal domain
MATDRSFQARNAEERERLRALLAPLGDRELRRPVGHGWTVAATLVHLAFWDLRAITLLDKFERHGVNSSPVDVDVINDTVRTLTESIPPSAAVRLALEAAGTVDRRIEELPDAMIEAIGAAGNPFNLSRHVHRAEHREEIERALR